MVSLCPHTITWNEDIYQPEPVQMPAPDSLTALRWLGSTSGQVCQCGTARRVDIEPRISITGWRRFRFSRGESQQWEMPSKNRKPPTTRRHLCIDLEARWHVSGASFTCVEHAARHLLVSTAKATPAWGNRFAPTLNNHRYAHPTPPHKRTHDAWMAFGWGVSFR